MMNRGGGPNVNFYMTGFRHAVLTEAVQQAKKIYRAPLSCGRAILHLGLREMLKNPRYRFSVFPLMRPDVPTNKWARDIAVRKMHHCMYSLSL